MFTLPLDYAAKGFSVSKGVFRNVSVSLLARHFQHVVDLHAVDKGLKLYALTHPEDSKHKRTRFV